MVIKLNVPKKNYKRTIITSALPYVHAIPHLGNLVGSMLPADVFYRYLRLKRENVISICGSDEHGTPAELAAEKLGVDPAELAEKHHHQFKKVLENFNIRFSLYGRTHSNATKEETYKILVNLYKNGYISEKVSRQPYSTGSERFLPDRYVEGVCPNCGYDKARGDQCDNCGSLLDPKDLINIKNQLTGKQDIEFRETKHLYIQLQKFEPMLKEWIQKHSPIPDHKKKEVLNLVKYGLVERAITRDMKWGFSVPWKKLGLKKEDYDGKVIYVWFDAVIGYIGITKDYFKSKGKPKEWEKWWKSTDTRVFYSVGKDNTIFHSILFPGMLYGTRDNYVLPEYIFIQEYLTSKTIKFSKSLKKGLSTEEALNILPADYWRFYLMSVLPDHQDTSFDWGDIEIKINTELNDNLGNFVNRVLTLSQKWNHNKVPKTKLTEKDKEALKKAKELVEEYKANFENKKIKKALETALELARLGNKFLGDEEPWKNRSRQAEVLYVCLNIVRLLGVLFWPFTPVAAEKIWEMLNLDQPKFDSEILESGHSLGERSQLFNKVDLEEFRKVEFSGKKVVVDGKIKELIKKKEVSVALAEVSGISVRKRNGALERLKKQTISKLNKAKRDKTIESYRYMLGSIDKNKAGLSSENLKEFVEKRGQLPNINTLTDAYNLVSLKSGFIMGAYNLDHIEGDIHLKVADGSETFTAIGQKSSEKIERGELVVADSKNAVITKWLTKQSEYVKVTPSTTAVIVCVQGNKEIPQEAVSNTLREVLKNIAEFCGGESTILFN